MMLDDKRKVTICTAGPGLVVAAGWSSDDAASVGTRGLSEGLWAERQAEHYQVLEE